MSVNPLTCFLPSYACLFGEPYMAMPDSSIFLTPNPDMSDEPGVQILGVRSKVSNALKETRGPTNTNSRHIDNFSLVSKRTRQMSQESGEGSSQSWYRHFHPPHPPEVSRSRSARLPPMRHGFDFRRPSVTPNQEDHVIDLTNEPETPPQPIQSRTADPQSSHSARAPRFGRPILTQDVVDLEEPDDPVVALSSSPEVQFVSASVRQQPLPRPRHDTRFQSAFIEAARRRHPPSRSRPFSQGMSMLPSMFATFGPPIGGRAMPQEMDTLFLGHQGLSSPAGDLVLDYAWTPFDMEPAAERPEDRRRQTYKAPSSPPEGFTRTLGDEDVAICPNCECELGIGEGKKQEIWVAKPCGHVYCGECAENRSKSKSRKINTSQKTNPFSRCQVATCGKQVSAPTAMFHLYL